MKQKKKVAELDNGVEPEQGHGSAIMILIARKNRVEPILHPYAISTYQVFWHLLRSWGHSERRYVYCDVQHAAGERANYKFAPRKWIT